MSLRVDKKNNNIVGTLWVRSADVTNVINGKQSKISMFTCVTGNLNMYKGCDVVIKLPAPRVNMPVEDLRKKVDESELLSFSEKETFKDFVDTLELS